MNAMNQIRSTVVQTLLRAGLTARGAWDGAAGTVRNPVISVDVEQTAAKPAALGGYLGVVEDAAGIREVYGRELEAVVTLTARALSAADCTQTLEQGGDALDGALPQGLRLRHQDWEAVRWEKENRCFARRCRLTCGAYFTAEMPEEETALLDFRLKGVLQS